MTHYEIPNSHIIMWIGLAIMVLADGLFEICIGIVIWLFFMTIGVIELFSQKKKSTKGSEENDKPKLEMKPVDCDRCGATIPLFSATSMDGERLCSECIEEADEYE